MMMDVQLQGSNLDIARSFDGVTIVGGGLAGSEAAWQVAERGIPVRLVEMRPMQSTEAHVTDGLAELVCSNSFRSDDMAANAVGLLHAELRRCGSLILSSADLHRVPAGSALAVDREAFSDHVTRQLATHPLIEVHRGLLGEWPPKEWGLTILATGPLTATPLAEAMRARSGSDSLAFFDAIAPIIDRESIDFDIAWFQSRYDKGDGADYINCPMDEATYRAFIDALLAADQSAFKDWERDTPYFEGCLPIEVMAERGPETLRFGPMKPVGLTNPNSDQRPHAVVQLRQDNALGTLFNMVGFQTKLKHAEQKRVFRMIPGLENARFARLGGVHRNTFVNSPKVLDQQLRFRVDPRVRLAGQITGVEGYVESAAIGLLAGRFAAGEHLGAVIDPPPETTALGALLAHITGGADAKTFQPMNINFGLFPPIANVRGGRKGRGDRRAALAQRALDDLDRWLQSPAVAA